MKNVKPFLIRLTTEIKTYCLALKQFLVKVFRLIPCQSLYSVHLLTTSRYLHSSLEESYGNEKEKKTPVIVDIHLKGNTARKQASNRMGYYIKQGWKITQT